MIKFFVIFGLAMSWEPVLIYLAMSPHEWIVFPVWYGVYILMSSVYIVWKVREPRKVVTRRREE